MFEIFIKCRHSGGESSLPAILKTSLARVYSLIPAPQPEVDEHIPSRDPAVAVGLAVSFFTRLKVWVTLEKLCPLLPVRLGFLFSFRTQFAPLLHLTHTRARR